jgi:hypothetical protein
MLLSRDPGYGLRARTSDGQATRGLVNLAQEAAGSDEQQDNGFCEQFAYKTLRFSEPGR